jgi:oxygen-independent coproporphyrinogen-3 oxidase
VTSSSPVSSLYVHIPFCERKCEYCDFASVGGLAGDAEYVSVLIREIEAMGEAGRGQRLNTIFFGGGTPGLLDPGLLDGIMQSIRQTFAIASDAEISLEANPSSVSEQRAERWLQSGFNRVSVGVQSLDDSVLKFLGRVHDSAAVPRAVTAIRRAGFRNLSCDLIYAVPGLTEDAWLRTVDGVVALAPEHISAYELTFEPGTPLYARLRRGQVVPAADDHAMDQHWAGVERLAAAGYAQYEVSNFSRPGLECRHNLAYWHNDFYFAAGLGAHGHLPPAAAAIAGGIPGGADANQDVAALRYWNTKKLTRYIAGEIRDGCEAVTRRQHAQERLMVGLRLSAGVDVDDTTLQRAESLRDAGFLTANGRRVVLTRRGQEVLNEVVTRLAA